MGLDLVALLLDVARWFPYYVALVLVPAILAAVIETRILGVSICVGSAVGRVMGVLAPTFEEAFYDFALTALFAPVFEELVFRGVPLALLGPLGLVVGSVAWVAIHPAWQMRAASIYLDSLAKKLGFLATSAAYYGCAAVFYGMMWLSGSGAAALVYHTLHNAGIVLADAARKIIAARRIERESETTYRFVKRVEAGSSESRESFMFVRRRSSSSGESGG